MQNIIIAFAKQEDRENFRRILGRRGIGVSVICNSGTQALFAMEDLGNGIVICGYKLKDMLYTELAENLPSHFQMLLIASQAKAPEICPDNVVYLPTPLHTGDLFRSLDLMMEQVRIRQKKKQKPVRQRSEAEEKALREAKEILMERHKMTEADAHRYLQKRSMENGISMAETAEMILMLESCE